MTAATRWLGQIVELVCPDVAATVREAEAPGELPFAVIHDWHERSLSPLIIETCSARRLSTGEHEDVRALHRRSAHGDAVREQTWYDALEPALRAIYRHGYPYPEAMAEAAHAARTYARAHDYSADDTAQFGTLYATTNTDANARVSSAANAQANARAYARAFARSDHELLSRAYPAAYVRACVSMACAGDGGKSAVYARLGQGLVDTLRRWGLGRV